MKTRLTVGTRAGSCSVAVIGLLCGIMALSTAAWAGPTPITSGQTLNSVPSATSFPSGTLIAGDTISDKNILDLGSSVVATFNEEVYDTSSGYDFLYQVTPTDLDGMTQVAATGFTGYTTAVEYITGNGGTAAPTSVLDVGGQTIDFNFFTPVANNTETYWLAVFTNASTAVGKSINVIDDDIGGAGDIGPGGATVPEATTWLFGLAIASVVAVGAFRKLMSRSANIGGIFAV